MSATLSWPDIILRLALAVGAGSLIGLDRGEHAQPAGLRTTVLISVAAAIAMIEANWLLVHTPDTHVSIVRLDLMRLPLGILSGIGFIGAGAILRRDDMVRGVTTAATIWLVTVIGLCFGGGQIGLGVAGTVIAIATLWLLKYVEVLCREPTSRNDRGHPFGGRSAGAGVAGAARGARLHTAFALCRIAAGRGNARDLQRSLQRRLSGLVVGPAVRVG